MGWMDVAVGWTPWPGAFKRAPQGKNRADSAVDTARWAGVVDMPARKRCKTPTRKTGDTA